MSRVYIIRMGLLPECPDCGAAIHDPEVHDVWHETLDHIGAIQNHLDGQALIWR